MSLGEMASWRPDFAAVKASGVLLDENPHWPGSYFVDRRNPAWQKRILDTSAPAVWAQGFHGFFLDTVDDPGHLEPLDPGLRSATRQARDQCGRRQIMPVGPAKE